MLFLPSWCDRSALAQFSYGFYAQTSLIASGMGMGFSSVSLPLLTKNDTSNLALLYDKELSAIWFASISSIASICGCIASILTMRAGRKIAMTIAGIVSIIGWIVIATSYQVFQILIGRFITGFATGLTATPVPVYSAEIAVPQYRTSLTSCTNLFICFGILLIYFLGFIIPDNWRLVAATSAAIPILSTILILFWLPESPRWLINRDEPLKAKEALLRLRGLSIETNEFIDEFNQLVSYHEKTSISIIDILPPSHTATHDHQGSSENLTLKKIKRLWLISKLPEVWKPFVILNTFFFIQQFCGIYVIMAYAVDFVIDTGITVDPYFVTVLIGIVQAVGALALSLCSSRMGRKPVSTISGVGMAVSLAVLGTYVQLNDKTSNFSTSYSAIPIVTLMVLVVTGSFGILAIPWAMIGELYPTKFVNFLGPVTTCLQGLLNFASIQIYPLLVKWNFTATLYLYCFISIIGILFVIFILPETHGRTKNQIEAQFKKN